MASLSLTFADNSFARFKFQNCEQSLSLQQFQVIIEQHLQVKPSDQLLFSVTDDALKPLSQPSDLVFNASNTADILLLDKSITSEAKLKDLQTFTSYDDELGTLLTIDLLHPESKQIPFGKKYQNLNISSSLLESDITENFNFKSLVSSQSALK